MKRLFFSLPMLLVGVTALAQGTVSFSNRTTLGDWKAIMPDGTPAGLSARPIFVNIYLADASGVQPTGASLASTTFRDESAAEAFFVIPIDEIKVFSLAPGSSSQKFIARFTGPSVYPQNVPLVINPSFPAGGESPGFPPFPPGELLPADLTLIGSIFYADVLIPEPSTIALGCLGAAVLLLPRRR
jgi:hypothetical protein